MSLFDTFKEAAQAAGSTVYQNASDWLEESTGVDISPSEGDEPAGNLSPQQVANGQTGSRPGLQPSKQDATILARADANAKHGIDAKTILIIVGVGIVALYLFKRK